MDFKKKKYGEGTDGGNWGEVGKKGVRWRGVALVNERDVRKRYCKEKGGGEEEKKSAQEEKKGCFFPLFFRRFLFLINGWSSQAYSLNIGNFPRISKKKVSKINSVLFFFENWRKEPAI